MRRGLYTALREPGLRRLLPSRRFQMNHNARDLSLLLFLFVLATGTLLSAQVFQSQTRLGASLAGDTWEPAIAADRYGHVYALIPDFPPSCKGCPSSIAYLVVSGDNGKTSSAPRQIADPGSGQIDVQLKVDPLDG